MIEAILKNITNNQASLELSTGEQISLNADFLPKDVSVGDNLIIEIMSQKNYQNKKNQTAKDTLNEILRT